MKSSVPTAMPQTNEALKPSELKYIKAETHVEVICVS